MNAPAQMARSGEAVASAHLRVAATVACTGAEGPHHRFALWVAGCSLRCPGCCNPELFDPQGGEFRRVDDLIRELARAKQVHDIEGLSVLGGEPTDQSPALAALLAGAREVGLGVIVFSGYTHEQLRARADFAAVWAQLDTLVDGPFEAQALEVHSPTAPRRYVGSHNQSLVHRTDRYADEGLWAVREQTHQAELQVHPDGRVDVHGEPQLARRLTRLLRRDASS